jgi:hypothetical protein
MYLVSSDGGRILFGSVIDLGPPPIAGDADCHDWRNCEKASRQFDATVARRFPLGTPQQVLETTLLQQHFERDPHQPKTCTPRGARSPIGVLTIECPEWDPHWDPKNALVYRWGRFPCGSTVGVIWSADRKGRIVHREGYFEYACL